MKQGLSFLLIFCATLAAMIFVGSNAPSGPPIHTHSPDGIAYSKLPVWHKDYKTTYTPLYVSENVGPQDELLETAQSPIPMTDRVKNYTGIQCVYSSIEMVGRWAEEPKLVNPPITSNPRCKGFSGPGRAADILNGLGVKFEQVYSNKQKARILLQKAVVEEGRGAVFGVPGHAMVLIHYDPDNDDIRYVDNSDSSLRIQKWTKSQFERRWDGWVLVIHADKDIVPYKVGGVWIIPIEDRDDPDKKFPRDHIPMPFKD